MVWREGFYHASGFIPIKMQWKWSGDKVSDYFPVSSGLRQGYVLSPQFTSWYFNGIHNYEAETEEWCGVECGGVLLSGLLLVNDTSLFGEDSGTGQSSLQVLEEWCLRWGMNVNADTSAIIYFRGKSYLPCDSQFSIVGEAIPVVTKCMFLGRGIIDQFLDSNTVVVNRTEAGRRALGSLLGGGSAVGMLYDCTFKKRTERVTCSREAWELHMKIMYIRYPHIYINFIGA